MGSSSNASVYSLYRNEENQLKLSQVSVSIANGLNDFKIIGGADKTIKEASLRVKMALKTSEFHFPNGKIVVNLSPVLAAKHGSSFDLAIALAVLAASKQIKLPPVCLAYGELTLSGQVIEPENLLWQLNLVQAKQQVADFMTYLRKLCPVQNMVVLGPALEDNSIPSLNVLSLFDKEVALKTVTLNKVDDYKQLDFTEELKAFSEEKLPVPIVTDVAVQSKLDLAKKELLIANLETLSNESLETYQALRNLDLCKDSFKIALAGGHSLALIGSNGSGKTELLHSAVYFLKADLKAQIEQSWEKLAELSNYILDIDFMTLPSKILNYRLQTGYLWHLSSGLIFLSELNKFRKESILCLEQFWQQQITLSRTRQQIISYNEKKTFVNPHCQLLVDFNPCPCGNLFEPWLTACTCSDYRIKLFNQRLTGAIWDRISMIALARRLETDELNLQTDEAKLNCELNNKKVPTPQDIRKQIENCRTWQKERNLKVCQHCCLNSQLSLPELDQVQALSKDEKNFLHILRLQRHFSYRRIMQIRTVALTLADLSNSKCQLEHYLQASNYCALPEELVNA